MSRNEDLINALKTGIKNKYDMDVDIQEQTTKKTNGVVKTGFMVKPVGKHIAPNIYPDLSTGEDINSLAESYVDVVYDAINAAPDVEITKEKANKAITMYALNYESNKDVIEEQHIPYIMVDGDIAAIARWQFSNDRGKVGSCFVNESIMKACDLTPQEVIDIGMNNVISEEFELPSMESIMGEFGIQPPTPTGMFILTSKDRTYGARAILQPEVLSAMHDHFRSDFYILPSSVHEVICISKEGAPSERELSDMIKEVNRTQVAPEEVLSDHLYQSDGKEVALADIERDEINLD